MSWHEFRFWWHVRVGRIIPLQWNHRLTVGGPNDGTCPCGWIIPGHPRASEQWFDPESPEHPFERVGWHMLGEYGPICRWCGLFEEDHKLLVVPPTEEATHTNYNTGEPCFCDAPFDYVPGPCMDAPEPITGDSPGNGTG